MTVVNGQVATQNFMKAADSVETLYQIFSLCGARTYVIVDGLDATVSWISIIASTTVTDQWTIKLQPTLDAQESSPTWNYRLKVTLNNYPSKAAKYENLDVTVTKAPCDCSLLTWDNPARTDVTGAVAGGPYSVTIPSATVNVASKSATPAIRSCYRNPSPPGCAETSTYNVVEKGKAALPAFVVQTGTSSALTYTPVAAAHIGTFLLSVTQVTTNGPDPVFDAV